MARERTAQRGVARANTRLSRRLFVQRMAGLGAVMAIASCTDQFAIPSPTSTPKLRRIGWLSGNSSAAAMNYAGPFREKLHELGYVEGRDIEIVFGIAENVASRVPGLAAELVALPVDILIAEAGEAQNAAKAATKSIPIVFTLASDPVASGLVTSLARPGGNITGVITASLQTAAKRVELLKEAVPNLARIGIISNANIANMTTVVQATEDAARTLRIETRAFAVRNLGELDTAVETMAREHFDGLVMLTGLSIVRDDHRHVPELAAKYRLPQMFADIEIVKAGGLMQFGANFAVVYRKAASLVDKILKGADPGELPVEQPTEFDFIVNLTMAERLGLFIPSSVLRQATEFIRVSVR